MADPSDNPYVYPMLSKVDMSTDDTLLIKEVNLGKLHTVLVVSLNGKYRGEVLDLNDFDTWQEMFDFDMGLTDGDVSTQELYPVFKDSTELAKHINTLYGISVSGHQLTIKNKE